MPILHERPERPERPRRRKARIQHVSEAPRVRQHRKSRNQWHLSHLTPWHLCREDQMTALKDCSNRVMTLSQARTKTSEGVI